MGLETAAVALLALVGFGFWWGWRQEQKAKREKAAVECHRRWVVSQLGHDYAEQHIKRRRSS